MGSVRQLITNKFIHTLTSLSLPADRGNGFEKKLFQHQNDRKRRGQESYQWSVDDM